MRPWDEPGGYPVYWPGGARHGGGVSLVCGFCAEHGKARADTAGRLVLRVAGEREHTGAAETARCRVPTRCVLADRLVVAVMPL
jgi:hypothetical protein